MMPTKHVVMAYVPVIHAGYLAFFRKFQTADAFKIFGPDVIAQFDYLRKEIRALEPEVAVQCLKSVFPSKDISVLTMNDLRSLALAGGLIVMPDEDICHELAKNHLLPSQTMFEPTFLRWNRNNITSEHLPLTDRFIAHDVLIRALMGRALAEAAKSSDWWRQVGAVLVRDGMVLVAAHNHHLPTDYTPYIDGDPRNAFFKGVNIELGTALHAEKAIICECARRGIATANSDLYVTTYPCPPCAKAIAVTGIRRLFFREGYSVLDGQSALQNAKIQIIQVV